MRVIKTKRELREALKPARRSDRTIGPVSAAAPCSDQFAAVRRTRGESSSRPSAIPAAASSSTADSSSATSRFEAMLAAAW